MTALDVMKHAKSYIDQLANGIDPISGKAISPDCVLNQVRLVRCLFYVSDILRQVIENGGQVVAKKRSGKKVPFQMTEEIRGVVRCLPVPVPITQFLAQFNNARDEETMKKLPPTLVTGWMVKKGFLFEEIEPDGHRKRCPTDAGRELGIFMETRQGRHGEYGVVLYDEAAQQFLIDNMDTILSGSSAKSGVLQEK